MQAVDAASPVLTKAGGHTFRPRSNGESSVDLVGACQQCHGPRVTSFNFPLLDYDNDGDVEGVQTEVQHLLDKVALMLPPAGEAKESLSINSSWTRSQLKAAYNWQFVKNDGSLGIHNMAYSMALLKASIADLEANK
jgi:hypothetical protein